MIFVWFWPTTMIHVISFYCFFEGCALDVQNKAGEHPLLTAVIYHSEYKVMQWEYFEELRIFRLYYTLRHTCSLTEIQPWKVMNLQGINSI